MSLEELKAIKRALGGTVNDVVLALVTAGLRDLLVARGETPPAAGLRAMVPVNIRAAASSSSSATASRRCSSTCRSPWPSRGARYRRVRAETMRLKASHQARRQPPARSTWPGWRRRCCTASSRSSLFATRLFNVTVTNVPGRRAPCTRSARRCARVIPLVPLAAEHAVGIAALSYDGRVCFCVNADRDAVPDVERIAAGITAELQALSGVANRQRQRRSAKRPCAEAARSRA